MKVQTTDRHSVHFRRCLLASISLVCHSLTTFGREKDDYGMVVGRIRRTMPRGFSRKVGYSLSDKVEPEICTVISSKHGQIG